MIAALFILALQQDTTGLSLTGAVTRALAAYPSVAAARAVRDRASAEAAEARAARMPRVVLDASLMRFQEPMLVLPLHSIPGPGQPPPRFDRTLVQAQATASWTVFDFGQRGSRIRAASLAESAAAASLGAAEQQVMARAAAGYLRLLTARGVLEAQDQRLRALEAEAARMRQLFAEGKAARIHVLRVEAELERARADRTATAAQVEVAERDLAQLTGAPYQAVHAGAAAAVRLADTTLASREALLAAARERSPALLESRRRAGAADAASGAVRATRLPELRLLGGYVDRGGGSGGFEAEWQAGMALSWPVWTGGARGSQIRRAEADARAAAEQLRLADLALGAELDRALAALRESRARVVSLQRALDASLEVARIERLALDVGSGTQSDYLDAEADLLRARAGLLEARHTEIAARIELARIAGELTLEWLAATLVESRP
jgi:outer membrane protein